jgi:4-amino-4-deoxy-L-arabinose transferase-like glycosyltransferase
MPCRPTRAERLALGAFFVLLTLVHVWGVHYRLDTLDEGYFVYTTSRVFAGELPYRDFATPYTPGFFYLSALTYRLFGLEIVTLRLMMLVARIGVFVLVYLLGRRIMPAPFAVLPVLMLLAEDPAPGVWESHPAWWATLFMLLAVWSVCRHCDSGRPVWWLTACASAGLSFAFKQNIGIFAAASLVAVALAEERHLPPLRAPEVVRRATGRLRSRLADRIRRASGPAALLALGLGTAWGMRAHPEPPIIIM